MSILLKNGTVVNSDRKFKADVYIKGGLIEEVGTDIVVEQNCTIVDCTGKFIVPGAIDPHVHLEMPFMGTFSKDGYESGSKMALVGGSTFYIDFIVPKKNGSLIEAYKEWSGRALGTSYCDFSFHCCVTEWNEKRHEEMETIVNEFGINSFKFFLAYKGALMVEDELLVKAFKRCKELGALCQVHAEHGDLVVAGQNEMIKKGIKGPEGHPQSRPDFFEGEATNRALQIARHVNVPLYVVHVSCKLAADSIERAQKEGQVCFGEALAGHLAKDDSGYYNEDFDTAAGFVMSPPFRPKFNQKALWSHLQNGVLSTTGTDHCTFTKKDKRMGINDFRKIPNGCGGMEDRPSVIWELGVNTGRISLSDFVSVTSTNSAKIFNLYPQKGVIAKGSDADIVIWDPEVKRTISHETHHSNIDFNVFEGMKINACPIMTISQGKIVVRTKVVDGVAVWDKPELNLEKTGRFVKRKPFGPIYDRIKKLDENLYPKKIEREN
ncbi:hydrantoinase/dihydropyrimidinase family member [Anaeramoeba flamelloides]|uniref:dihydropyrimidinase n=1 Tax=Anaeramoeba flamelloides TaxID=1746091 RepID=A0ABQ8X7Q1_9EUKA|nr:hydrantoinase/dihydropyrimidinase family member [Anaeramoeba flamelloides]